MTGSPFENDPLLAFSQFELLEPGLLGYKTYDAFKRRYAIYERAVRYIGTRKHHYPKLLGFHNLEELRSRMAPHCHVVTRDMVDDLPDLVRSVRSVPLTQEQARIYDEVCDGIVAQIEGEGVNIGPLAPKFIKLQQVLSGFLVDKEYKPWEISGPNPRAAALVDEVTGNDGKVIVWCAFRRDVEACVAALEAAGRKVLQYHGGTPTEARVAARESMQAGSDPYGPDLVGHPRSGGVGLNLAGATKIVWYSHTFDAITRLQADERATEVKGGNVPILDLVGVHPSRQKTMDHVILATQARKTDLADYLSRDGLKNVISDSTGC